MHVARSFKLHRPRGIFSCGIEEPNGLFEIGDHARRTPNTRATDINLYEGLVARPGNVWPSLKFDILSLNNHFAGLLPAGFYYKTFMWPAWRLFEPAIRRAAGLGHAADPHSGSDPDRYDELSMNAHTLVVGGGVAGMQAALDAADAGHDVLLMEGQSQLGGWTAAQGEAARTQIATLAGQIEKAGVRVVTACTVIGLYDHQFVSAVQVLDENGHTRERLWKMRVEQIVLACGAFERPMLFPDNDRPGVMLASAVQRYAELYGVACGRRVLLAAACDSAYGVAHSLQAAGIEVAAIIDHRGETASQAPNGVPVYR
jgi:sarcosine oxidase subunit alpha